MSLFDILFPEQAQAIYLRRIAEKQSRESSVSATASHATDANVFRLSELEARMLQLERDLGFVSLTLGSILTLLEKKGSVSRSDIVATMQELDASDRIKDDSLDLDVLRSWGKSDK